MKTDRPSALVQIWVLVCMQAKVLRYMGPFAVVVSIVLPSVFIVLFKYMNPNMDVQTATRIVVGSVITSCVQTTFTNMTQTVAAMRESKTFSYYATLPVSKLTFLVGLLITYFAMSIPSAILVFVVGNLAFGLRLVPSLSFLPTFVLLSLGLAAMGTVLAIYSRSGNAAISNATALSIVFMTIAPVYYPITVLPQALRALSMVMPVTWGSASLVYTLAGQVDPQYYENLGILFIFVAILWVLMSTHLHWREHVPS
ncbi:MAG: ABC transporter permease [Bacillota bacterium]